MVASPVIPLLSFGRSQSTLREVRQNRSIPWGHQWRFSETLDDVDPADRGGILHGQ
jgi:hypothetical protein